MGPDEYRFPMDELPVPFAHVEHVQSHRFVRVLPLFRLRDVVTARAQVLVERYRTTVPQHLLQLRLALGDLKHNSYKKLKQQRDANCLPVDWH